MITLATNQYWTSSSDSPKIQISFYYEKERDGADMKYRVKTSIRALSETSSGSFGYNIFQTVKFDDVEKESGYQLKPQSTSRWTTPIEHTTDWFTISNKTSGTTNLKIQVYSTQGAQRNKTYEYSLEVDPAYPVITSFSVSKRDETSVQYNYSVDSGIDYAWYSINGGSWQGLPSNNVVSGLSAGQGYNFKLKVRRQDSQLTAETTDSVYQETYPYPNINSTPNFVIGNAYTLGLNNPLGRTCDIKILASDNTQMASGITTGTSITGFNDSTSVENYYQSIPNSKSGTYKVRLIVSALSRDTTINGGTYSVNEETNRPTFNDFTYVDVNATTLALTGDSQSIIPKYSNVRATISTSNKAVAKNYATMSSYKFTCGSKNESEDYSSSSAVNITINNVESGDFTIQAIDSRQLSQPITKSASTIVNYNELIKDTTSSLLRTGGVSEETRLTLKGKIWHQSFGDVTNSIVSTSYKYKILNSSDDYEDGETTITPTIDQDGNFTFTGVILGDTNTGFDIANSYEVVVSVSDELSTINYTFKLSSGKPHIAYHKNGVSIMGAYNPANGGKLQIDGENIVRTILNNMYPVGSIYMSVNNVNPHEYFGGIWVAWGSGQVPVGVDTNVTEFNTVEKTGGNLTHLHSTGDCTLTAAQSGLRSHGHGAYSDGAGGHSHTSNGYWRNGSGSEWVMSYSATGSTNNSTNISWVGDHAHTIHVNNEGNWNAEQAHNHGNTGSTSSLQPYITCYMWKRTD